MAVAKVVADALGFLNASCLYWLDPFAQLAASWQYIICLLSLELQGNTSQGDCWGQGTCPLLPLLWTSPSLPEFPSPSPISTHCWALPFPKGLWDVGYSFFLPSPIPAERQRDVSFGSRQIKYLSVAEAHNKIVFQSHPCSPRGLSGILKIEFLLAPKPSLTLCGTIKIYTVVPYQQLIKYNSNVWGAVYCKSPALSLGYYHWKPCSFTLLAKCHGLSLAGNRMH